jgi:hypothetical protein
MESKRRERRAWPAAAVLLLSLLLHGALLFLPLPGPGPDSKLPATPRISVDLVERPRPEDRTPEPRDPSPRPRETGRVPQEEEAEATPEKTAARPVAPADPSSAAAATTRPPPDRIRAQLLGTARELGRETESERTGQPEGLRYSRTPALPSQPGWLNRYTGPVETSIDRWRGNDGSRSARIVTGSGQVFCVRTRAPTMSEIFNPWMSSAVPMVSGCGRERPDAPDPANPWLRRPGTE